MLPTVAYSRGPVPLPQHLPGSPTAGLVGPEPGRARAGGLQPEPCPSHGQARPEPTLCPGLPRRSGLELLAYSGQPGSGGLASMAGDADLIDFPAEERDFGGVDE